MDKAETLRFLVIALVSLASGIVVLIGAARMFDLQSYPIARFAAVVAILPCAVGFPISLPFGIWALLVLSRRDVRNAFADEGAESQRKQTKTESGVVVGMTMVLGMVAGLALGAAMDQDNIGVYMTLGMIFGIVFGSAIDMNNRRKSKE